MDVEHGQSDDEESRANDKDELTSGAKRTGVAGDEHTSDRSGVAGVGSDDRSGLLGHFRSPSTAGFAGPQSPNNTGLVGGPSAADRSGLLGSTGAPSGDERQEQGQGQERGEWQDESGT